MHIFKRWFHPDVTARREIAELQDALKQIIETYKEKLALIENVRNNAITTENFKEMFEKLLAIDSAFELKEENSIKKALASASELQGEFLKDAAKLQETLQQAKNTAAAQAAIVREKALNLYKLLKVLQEEGRLLAIEDEGIKKFQTEALDITTPRQVVGEYMPLSELVNAGTLAFKKTILQLRGAEILLNDRPVQGVTVTPPVVTIRAEHYTSWEAATQIRSTGAISPVSPADPFAYLLERGLLGGKGPKEIRKIVGAVNADTLIMLTVRVPITHVWINAVPGRPVKFAVDGGIRAQKIEELRKF